MSQAKTTVKIAGSADGGDRVPDLSPREAQERWLSKLRVDKAESTVSAYHYQTKLFVEWCEENGIVDVDELTGWDLEGYETSRREKGVEAVTLNKELGTIKRFLEYCARVELVDETLPEKVVPPDVEKQADVDETKLSGERAREHLAYYDEHEDGCAKHAALALAWFTGARVGALYGLDLEYYHSGDQYVEFLHEPDRGLPLKNDTDGERAVALPEYAVDVVDEYIDEHRRDYYADDGSQPLFTTANGRASDGTLQSWIYLATQPCLLKPCPHGKDRETCEFVGHTFASKCPSSRAPHQVRTGSITWHLNRGVPIEKVAERVNTSIRTLKKHYDVTSRREEMEARRRESVDKLTFDTGGEQ
jgi:site-specific recombinase XerD